MYKLIVIDISGNRHPAWDNFCNHCYNLGKSITDTFVDNYGANISYGKPYVEFKREEDREYIKLCTIKQVITIFLN